MTFSLSTVETTIANWIVTTESHVQEWVIKAQADIQLALQEIQWGMEWIAKNAPKAIAELQAAVALAGMIPGFQLPASILTGINAAVALLASVATSSSTAVDTPSTLTSAYNAFVAVKGFVLTVFELMTKPKASAAPVAAAA